MSGIQGVGGFGTYSLINSSINFILGFGRRNDRDEQQHINDRFNEELTQAKNEFQEEMEAQKVALTRAKMKIAREYRQIEAQDRLDLNEKRAQLMKFISEDLPINPAMLQTLLLEAQQARQKEKEGKIVPLNIILLHAHNDVMHGVVNDTFERLIRPLGAVKFLPWANKTASGNSALLNLNVVMRDIPTLVISPRYIEADKKVYFSAALWDSNSDRHPLIRPLFSMNFDHKQLKTPQGQKILRNKLIFGSTMVAGCARDSYMLMNHGTPPALPALIQKNEWLQNCLQTPDGRGITRFLIGEYQNNVTSLLSLSLNDKMEGKDEILYLTQEAAKALETFVQPQIK